MAGVDDKKRRTVAACVGVWGGGGRGEAHLVLVAEEAVGVGDQPRREGVDRDRLLVAC